MQSITCDRNLYEGKEKSEMGIAQIKLATNFYEYIPDCTGLRINLRKTELIKIYKHHCKHTNNSGRKTYQGS